MKFVAPPITLAFAVTLLAACSSGGIDSKKVEYKSANRAPTLETPPDLVAPTRDDRFAVPDAGGKGGATYSAYSSERKPEVRAARANDVLPSVDKMRIERSGNQRWLVVAGTPAKTWDSVKEFWQNNGLIIKVEQPEAGVMETDWAENRAKIPQDFIRNALGKVIDSVYSTSERDKFRTRLEPGSEPGTTEIYISHRGMYEVFVSEGKDQTKWQPRPPDPEVEAEMLRRLMVHLGAEQKQATNAVAAAKQDHTVERATVVKMLDGTSKLQVKDRFDRAWQRVGLALDRIGFTVEDRDRTKGIYFVRYADPEAEVDAEKKGSWLTKMNPFKGSDLSALQKIQYRIHVGDEGAYSAVRVLSREGGADDSETARRILALLHEQMK